MPLFGPPDVKKLQDKRDVPGLIKALGYSKDWQIRNSAAYALAGIDDPRATEALVGAVRGSDDWLRGAAATALGQAKDLRAVEPLIAALKDATPAVRKNAALALGGIGDARAAQPLIGALGDRETCAQAAEALGKIGDPKAVEPLLAVLGKWSGGKEASFALGQLGAPALDRLLGVFATGTDVEARKHAALALGQIKGDQAADALLDGLKDSHWGIRLSAVQALRQIKDPRAASDLALALGDDSAEVRREVAEALAELGWKPGKDAAAAAYWVSQERWDECALIGAPAVEPLVRALQDPNDKTRTNAARTLGEIGDARALTSLLHATLDHDMQVRITALTALDKIQGLQAVEPLLAAIEGADSINVTLAKQLLDKLKWTPGDNEASAAYWIYQNQWDRCARIGTAAVGPLISTLSDRDVQKRAQAAEMLSRIPDARAVQPLVGALKDGSDKVRGLAAKALGANKDIRTVDALIAALADATPEVRLAAQDALAQVGPDAVGPLIAELTSGWRHVTLSVVPVLGRIRDVRAVEPLVELLQARRHPDVTSAVATALGEIGDGRAFEPLIAALQNGDPQARAAAAHALSDLNDTRAVPALIAALDDEARPVRDAAIKALGMLKDSRAVERLASLIDSDEGWVTNGAAVALEKIGWQGSPDETGARYWILRNKWDRCAALGARAVEPLIAVLAKADQSASDSAAKALAAIGDARAIAPLRDKAERTCSGVIFQALAAFGAEGVDPLMQLLGSRVLEVRIAAAGTLVGLYRSGGLGDAAKNLIQHQRDRIITPHHDEMHEDRIIDVGCFGDTSHTDNPHHDSGIGVEFPL